MNNSINISRGTTMTNLIEIAVLVKNSAALNFLEKFFKGKKSYATNYFKSPAQFFVGGDIICFQYPLL